MGRIHLYPSLKIFCSFQTDFVICISSLYCAITLLLESTSPKTLQVIARASKRFNRLLVLRMTIPSAYVSDLVFVIWISVQQPVVRLVFHLASSLLSGHTHTLSLSSFLKPWLRVYFIRKASFSSLGNQIWHHICSGFWFSHVECVSITSVSLYINKHQIKGGCGRISRN